MQLCGLEFNQDSKKSYLNLNPEEEEKLKPLESSCVLKYQNIR